VHRYHHFDLSSVPGTQHFHFTLLAEEKRFGGGGKRRENHKVELKMANLHLRETAIRQKSHSHGKTFTLRHCRNITKFITNYFS